MKYGKSMRQALVVCTALLAALLVPTVAMAQNADASATDALESAILRFNEGDYVGAQHALQQIEAGDLTSADRSRHSEYLQRSGLAVSMQRKSDEDLQSARLAESEGRVDDARRILNDIMDNKFAATETKSSAERMLASMDKQPAAPSPAAKTDTGLTDAQMDQLRTLRAASLTRRADEMVDAGKFGDAKQLYERALQQIPGYPEAVAGLKRLEKHGQVSTGAVNLLDRIQSRNAIAWQRTEASYREAEREVRDHVINNRYDIAKQVLLRAKQAVESGKAFADPVARYHALKHDVAALEEFVVDEERRYNENVLQRQRSEALQSARARERRALDAKRERMNSLMVQARQLRRDRDLAGAVRVAKQVLAIEPHNDDARWFVENLEDALSYRFQERQRDRFYKQQQDLLVDVEEVRIPIVEEITYPPNWKEIIDRPTRTPPGSERRSGVDGRLQSRLDKPLPVQFDGTPLNKVMQAFADAHQVNIVPNWKDLAAAGIPSDTPIHLQLHNPVPMRRALREVLDQAGGAGVDLGYYADEGVVTIATREFLNKKTTVVPYDVRDLLMPIPHFDDAPQMDLSKPDSYINLNNRNANASRQIFPEDEDEEVRRQTMDLHAKLLIDTILSTVEPDSWRENGGDVGAIRELNGQLVITQTPTGHARVGGLLSKLREQRAVQVAVEARFITVQSNYLEELGMDLDVVLNAGNAGFDFVPGPGGTRLVDPTLGSQLLLPRSFSRLGFTPNPPAGLGTALAPGTNTAATPLQQPFENPALVPSRGNSGLGGSSGSPVPILNNILSFTDPGQLTSDLPGTFAGNPTLQPALQIFGSFLDNIQVDFLIRATQADSRTTLLTAPRLVLFNGQRAWVAVVNQSSFVSSLEPVVDAQGQAPATRTIETGAVLDAQATVSADKRYVTLTLRPSVGRLLGIETFQFNVGPGGGGLFVQLPNITRQVVRTTVSVPDGGTLLIGGQKLAGEIEVEAGVPVLSKIPILKRFYDSRTLVKDEQVLLILIKPKIIIQSEAEQEAFPSFTEG